MLPELVEVKITTMGDFEATLSNFDPSVYSLLITTANLPITRFVPDTVGKISVHRKYLKDSDRVDIMVILRSDLSSVLAKRITLSKVV